MGCALPQPTSGISDTKMVVNCGPLDRAANQCLAQAKLKSGLDVSFANVNLAKAKLTLATAQNDVQAAMAQLSAAMGYETPRDFQLVDNPVPTTPPPDPKELIADALRDRPDIGREQMNVEAAHKFANAERDLMLPSISAVASGGLTPYGDPLLHSQYGAVGFNLNLPIFNGFQFNARRKEARLKEEAEKQKLQDIEDQAVRDVRVAWLNADTAYQRLGLTEQLLDQTKQELDLAQARYKLGLSSIVEVSQAQLDETEAEIEQAGAKYDYATQLAQLNHELGRLR